MPENKGWKSPYLLLTVTMLLWGSAFSSSKSVVAQMPHTVAALLRFGGGAIALLAAVALFGRPAAPASARGGGRAALAGLLGVFAYNGFFFWGLSLAPSLDAGILIPVLSPVLTSAFLLSPAVTGPPAHGWRGSRSGSPGQWCSSSARAAARTAAPPG
ncbi:EamA family transporter [Streptomyces sp. NPDC059426]|uniref:EamA family transporter n=1 Tax=Streptomyces sp. NPDC059426 TaxID=3346827 RepID=UPI003687A5BD